MKLNNIKTGLLLAGLLLLFGNVKAQDNPFKPEWFVYREVLTGSQL